MAIPIVGQGNASGWQPSYASGTWPSELTVQRPPLHIGSPQPNKPQKRYRKSNKDNRDVWAITLKDASWAVCLELISLITVAKSASISSDN